VELADGTSVAVQTSGKQKITLRDGGLVLEQRMRVTSETDATSFPCTMTVTWIGTKVRP
jgi:hypothetical protein